jgi:hypothetical protein
MYMSSMKRLLDLSSFPGFLACQNLKKEETQKTKIGVLLVWRFYVSKRIKKITSIPIFASQKYNNRLSKNKFARL